MGDVRGPADPHPQKGIMAASQPATGSRPVALYAHTKAQQWGLAILAWERGPSRGYQFEDGVLRIFNEGYYELLEEVDAPADKAAQIIADLRRKLGDAAHHDGSAHTAPATPALSFDDQVRLFRSRYPDGFADAGWVARYREKPDGRRAKGHAEPAFADAQETLAADVLDRALAEERESDVAAAALRVLEQTSLVTGTQLAPLRGMPPGRHGHFAQVLRALLHGEEAYELRFERLVAALTQHRRSAPAWQLATALPALFAPEQHICVRPTTFREQAKWMAPRLVLPTTPSGAIYVRLADMARAVKTALEREKLHPRDLMDVYQFMVMTLAPSAREPAG
jgi:hypothetical protein